MNERESQMPRAESWHEKSNRLVARLKEIYGATPAWNEEQAKMAASDLLLEHADGNVDDGILRATYGKHAS